MLVMSRKKDEEIVIGDSIIIKVVEIRGDKARLGIEAPSYVPVHCQEVYKAIKREDMKAGKLETKIEGLPKQEGQQGGSGGLGGSGSGGTGGDYPSIKSYPSIY